MSDAELGTPRRAVKACSTCRSDKVRCDGARPCHVCIKRGKASLCADGCVNCRQKRIPCSGHQPCQRCQQDNLDCYDGIDLATSPSVPIDRLRRSHPTLPSDRAKLACASCRRDNKKCDDVRPCPRCISRGEECVHVDRSPKLVKLRCDGCRKDNKRCDESRPCRPCVDRGIACVTPPRKGGGQGSRVKTACLYCRRDKLRCDGNRPCASCDRRNLDCKERPCSDCVKTGEICAHRINQSSPSGVQSSSVPSSQAESTPNFINFLHGSLLPAGLPPGQFLCSPPGPPDANPPIILAIPSHALGPHPISNGSNNPDNENPLQLMYLPYQPGGGPPYIEGANGAPMMVVAPLSQLPEGFPPYALVNIPPPTSAMFPITINPGDSTLFPPGDRNPSSRSPERSELNNEPVGRTVRPESDLRRIQNHSNGSSVSPQE